MRQEEHRTIREQLGAFALGQLDDDERVAVQAHLDGCPPCRAELAAIAPLATPLLAVRPERIDAQPVPPTGLGEAVLSRIRAEADAAAPFVPARRDARRLLLAAAAVVIVVAVGATGFGLGSQGRSSVEASIPLESVPVRAGADVSASAEVVPHTWGVEIKLVATGFERGQAYRVSVTDVMGRTADAGGFVGTGTDQMRCNLNSSVLRADAAAFQVTDLAGVVVLSGGL